MKIKDNYIYENFVEYIWKIYDSEQYQVLHTKNILDKYMKITEIELKKFNAFRYSRDGSIYSATIIEYGNIVTFDNPELQLEFKMMFG